MVAACLSTQAEQLDAEFTSVFRIADCQFSVFGGNPYFPLDPGRQWIFRGVEQGQPAELVITVLDETREIKVVSGGRTRTIMARVFEERDAIAGVLTDLGRQYYARCIQTGDVYMFGEEVQIFENGEVVNQVGSWEAGINGAKPGIIMPGSFFLGARYFQYDAFGAAINVAENIGMGLVTDTPAGRFENCVRIKETDGLKPDAPPSVKTYAPGVGLIDDDGNFRLVEFRFGTTEVLPRSCTYVPFSHHTFFPISPGIRRVLVDEENEEPVVRTITVLDEVRTIVLTVGGEEKLIPTRVVEARETVGGVLSKMTRDFFAQCVETGDVYSLGSEIDAYSEDGTVVSHEGSWLAGVNSAQPGIVMPGIFVAGARYDQQRAPGVIMRLAVNLASDLTSNVPAGTFTGCVSVVESDSLHPTAQPLVKVYAPGIGLINDGDRFKLSEFTSTNTSDGSPILSILDAALLSWPATDRAFRIESSSDLETWNPISRDSFLHNGQNQIPVPRDASMRYFRLVPR